MKKPHLSPAPWVACLLALILAMALPGCKSEDVVNNAYKTLGVAAATYDGAMQAAADLDRRGKLDIETKQKIIALGRKYKAAHRLAGSALEAYTATTREEDAEKLNQALKQVSRIIGELSAELNQHVGQ